MSANLYDLLNVAEDATPEQIRAAWKDAIADLDPTQRRFRAFNDAAGVLLDAERRTAYDAELAHARAAEEQASAADGAPAVPSVDLVKQPEQTEPAEQTVDEADGDSTTDEPDTDASDEPARASARTGGPSPAALIGVGIAALLALALAIWIATLDGVRADESPKERAAQADVVDEAKISAEAAAERMIPAMLSYDYRSMDTVLERMLSFFTDEMAERQQSGWPAITEQAVKDKIVVEARVSATALTRVDPEGKRATVVVYIDQQRKDIEAEPLQMWATLSLVRDSDSESGWLLEDLCTTDDCG